LSQNVASVSLIERLRKQPRIIRQFVKFGFVGAIGSIVDFSVLIVLKEYLLLNLYVANTFSFSAAVCSNFLWNSIWTFRGVFRGRKRHRFIPFLLVSIIGLGINQFILYVAHEATGLDNYQYGYLVAKVAATIVVMIWNFIANKYWTFREQWYWGNGSN
jgi:putative flippase GtrA